MQEIHMKGVRYMALFLQEVPLKILLVKQVCLASEMHEPYLIYTKIPAFTSREYLENRRSRLARNTHEGCQIHGIIPARRILQET